MAEATKIQWTDHTFNPWRGCTKVHAGCTHCYAERGSKRNPAVLGVWGDHGTRVVAAEAMWREPLKWNKAAEAAGERRRVFCASLADVFEDWKGPVSNANGNVLFKGNVLSRPWRDEGNPETEQLLTLSDVRARLFALIDATPWLDWQLVTKRPENVRRMVPVVGSDIVVPPEMERPFASDLTGKRYRPNVWIGTSISDQETADKYVPELLKLRDLTPVLFLSIEPLLGPVDVRTLLPKWFYECQKCLASGESDDRPGDPCGCEPADGIDEEECDGHLEVTRGSGIDWVIVGGESGPKARPCDVAWVRSIVGQCKAASVPCFVKQLGAASKGAWGQEAPCPGGTLKADGVYWHLSDKKGGDPDEWPDDLRVREFPAAKGGAS